MIPKTRDEAIDMLVEQDVARWGESEREAARQMHAKQTYGLALNALYSRAELAGSPDAPALKAAAEQELTVTDMRVLRGTE